MTNVERRYTKHHLGIECSFRLIQNRPKELGIDIHEGEEVHESAFKALVREAVALNTSGNSNPAKKAKS
jgi:hypothetical protein